MQASMIAGIVTCALSCAPPVAAGEAVVMPVAGVEMESPLPVRVAASDGAWPAGARRLHAQCLTHLPDGTVLICSRRELLALGPDGRLRSWGPPVPAPGRLTDAAVARDGSIIALDGRAVRRLGAAGEWERLTGFRGIDGAVVALPGGGAILIGDDRGAVLEISPDGERRVVLARLPGFGQDYFAADAVSELPDGSVAVAAPAHVLRVARDGTTSVLAGGKAAFADGSPGIGTRVGSVSALGTLPGGGLVIAADAGLLELSAHGRLRRIAPSPPRLWRTDPEAVGVDGRPAGTSPLGPIVALDAPRAGEMLALTASSDYERSRLVALAPLESSGRLSVAMPSGDRLRLRDGFAEIVSTAPATGRLDIFRDRKLVASRDVAVAGGLTTVPVPQVGGGRALTARVEVADAAGRVAVHHLGFMPALRLGRVAMRRAANVIVADRSGAMAGMQVDRCRRIDAVSFRCRWKAFAEASPTLRGTAVIRLGDDGLIEYSERRRSGKIAPTRYLEPR